MSLPESVEAVANDRTEKLFIVLDWDTGDGKLKVINPDGNVLNVVKLIFRMDDPKTVLRKDFESFFSPKQLERLASYEQEAFQEEEKKRLASAAARSQRASSSTSTSSIGGSSRSRSSRKDGLIDRTQSAAHKRAMAEWQASELTFYRHRIENLRPSDVFRIVIDGIGIFQISKADFLRDFNYVVMNSDYRTQGVYRVMDFPEAARKYLI